MDERDKRQFLYHCHILSTSSTESHVWRIPTNIPKKKKKKVIEYPLADYGIPGFKAPVDKSCTLDRILARQFGRHSFLIIAICLFWGCILAFCAIQSGSVSLFDI